MSGLTGQKAGRGASDHKGRDTGEAVDLPEGGEESRRATKKGRDTGEALEECEGLK